MFENKALFIIACGRSGTKAMARFLGIEHEGPEKTYFNFSRLERRVKSKEFFGKVSNHYSRYHRKLMEKFPEALFIHVIRNGRDVVKSFDCLRRKAHYSMFNGIKENISDWEKLSYFEQLCWYWKCWNEQWEKDIPITIRFEDICHIIPKKNTTMNNKHRSHIRKFKEGFTEEEEKSFQRICGPLMKKYGYK